MHRTAPRLPALLACAAVPVMLVATGCSSGSGSKSKATSSPTESSPSASATVKPATYSKLPEPCKTISSKTVDNLVPKAENKDGKALPSSDTNDSGSCLWTGLDDSDVKNLQYRSLTISLKRFPNTTLGPGDKRAAVFAQQQSDAATKAQGAKNVQTGTASGIGDQASTVKAEAKKDGDNYTDQTVIARTANVVVTVEYDGAGFQGAKTPNADDLLKSAQDAAKEVIASVQAANK